MENNQNPSPDQQQILAEILENTRKTRNYIKWQLIITVALVVIPLFLSLIAIPLVLKSLTSAYSSVLIQ